MRLLKFIWFWGSLPAAAITNTNLSYKTGMSRNPSGNSVFEKRASLICWVSQDRHATNGTPEGWFHLTSLERIYHPSAFLYRSERGKCAYLTGQRRERVMIPLELEHLTVIHQLPIL